MRLSNEYQSHAYKWALQCDGEISELFQTQIQALRRMAILRKRYRAHQWAVTSVKSLFDDCEAQANAE